MFAGIEGVNAHDWSLTINNGQQCTCIMQLSVILRFYLNEGSLEQGFLKSND